MTTTANQFDEDSSLISFTLSEDWEVSLQLDTLPLVAMILAITIAWLLVRWWMGRRYPQFEIDAAEFGFGDHKVSFKPNNVDRQIAYSIWVELSTRKVGLPIDLDDDVIAEVYDSWYAFFAVTRELIKDIPVSKVRHDSTGKIISLSIEVLNEGLRPHLTKWQARFRHWYDLKMDSKGEVCPQDVQKEFPSYDALSADLLQVNQRLRTYRTRMYELVTGKREQVND